ncbi:MAG: hypothetical protein HY232_19915 [Acidobacteria bacterium]|nr:hypothetical protein [Acidobacteriota bacterium]
MSKFVKISSGFLRAALGVVLSIDGAARPERAETRSRSLTTVFLRDEGFEWIFSRARAGCDFGTI